MDLRNLKLTGGFAKSVDLGEGLMSDGLGGAIESFSDLTISTISENEGFWAIDHQGAAMDIKNSTISRNVGGGVLFLGTSGGIAMAGTLEGTSSLTLAKKPPLPTRRYQDAPSGGRRIAGASIRRQHHRR